MFAALGLQGGPGLAVHGAGHQQARLLLESTDASVTEIGYQTGFNSSNSFIRTFKSLVGETPGRYRERCQGGKYENGKDDDT